MRLVRFSMDDPQTRFGYIRAGQVMSFERGQAHLGWAHPELRCMQSYLEGLPQSFESAQRVADRCTGLAADAELDAVRLHPPVKPPALLDFGLSPRHLKNSARTLIQHELGSLSRILLTPLLAFAESRLRHSKAMPYYKCNHNAIIGDGDVVGWPAYTSYLDIEPELALVVGPPSAGIAGYTIFNDASARDVQMPEMFGGGPARSKDFDDSNGLGPWLVTPDELPDPLALDVKVAIGTRDLWRGSTREYARHPEDVVAFLREVFTPLPGTVLGMGTIPDCTGLDNDRWLHPGDRVEIRVQGLGSLRQQIGQPPADLQPSRWKRRQELRV